MRISDWSSDVCSSDLTSAGCSPPLTWGITGSSAIVAELVSQCSTWPGPSDTGACQPAALRCARTDDSSPAHCSVNGRSEEHTSELQSLMRISYAVFCLKKKI